MILLVKCYIESFHITVTCKKSKMVSFASSVMKTLLYFLVHLDFH